MPNRLHVRRRSDQLALAAVFFSIVAIAVGVVGAILVLDLLGKTERSVCSVVAYAERQATVLNKSNPRASRELDTLGHDMRATGIRCPPREQPLPIPNPAGAVTP